MLNISSIEILGLFGETDIHIPVQDNRIIIVGYNGVGKSTVLNIFYFFISQQWRKLAELEFASITVTLTNRKKLKVEKKSISDFLHARRRRGRYFERYRLQNQVITEIGDFIRAHEVQAAGRTPRSSRFRLVESLSQRFKMPRSVADEIVHDYFLGESQTSLDLERSSNLDEVDEYLSKNLRGRILFLPTYRRIEKDLKTVFPEIEEELQNKLAGRSKGRTPTENYIELVQFGMDDVKSKMGSRLERIRGYALAQVNSLTTKYLRDVIRDEASNFDADSVSDITETSVRTVFTKVDSTILSDRDKEKIFEVVHKIKSGMLLRENEKYVAHYVTYLVELGRNISQLELPIVRFVEICNSYLFGKSFLFDNIAYRLVIQHDSGRPVEMEDLSSGEKQIVSLFSHLLLDDEKNNYIVIDEPELSLSVDWQQRFLEDISNLESCKFIAAVTHSPFIFENRLDRYAKDLLELSRGQGS